MAKGFEASLPLYPQQYQLRAESSFRFAQNALERAAANQVLTATLVLAAAVGVITVERGIAYSTPGFGQAEKFTDWELLLQLFGREPEFNRPNEAKNLLRGLPP